MKRIVLSILVVVILMIGFGITAMAVADSTEEGYVSLLEEVIDKFTPFSIGKKLESIRAKDDTVIASYGNLNATAKEVEFMKLTYQLNAEYRKTDKKTISTDEAVDMVLKQKLLITDAKSRGLVLQPEQLDQSLNSLRESYGVDERGTVTKNEDLYLTLKTAGLSYDEFETAFLKDKLSYELLMYDYVKLIYQEKKGSPALDFDVDEVLNTHLNGLLATLKTQ